MAAATLVVATMQKNQYIQRALFFTGAANSLDNNGLQDIFTLDVEGAARICCRLTVAVNALAAFAIQGLFNNADNTWYTLRSTAGQFTSPTGILVDTSGDLTSQAVGTGWFIMDCAGLTKLKLQANSSAAGGSTIAISGGAL